MTAPLLPALVMAGMLGLAAALATGPSAVHSSHHPPEMSGAERAFATVAAALALRWSHPQ